MRFRIMLSVCLFLLCSRSTAQGLIEQISNPSVRDLSFNGTLLYNLMDASRPTLLVTYDYEESSSNDPLGKSVRYLDKLDQVYGSIPGNKPFKLIGVCETMFSEVQKAIDYTKRWKNVSIAFDNWQTLLSESVNKSSVRLYFVDADKQLVYVEESNSLDPEVVVSIMNQIASKEISAPNRCFDEKWLPCSEKTAKYIQKVTKSDDYRVKYKVANYYRSGKIQFDGYANRINPLQLHGYCRFYYENGQIQKEYELAKGKISSPIIAYHPNGKKAMEGEYIDGERSNYFTYYYPTGERKKLAKYQAGAGRPDSLWTGWMKDGTIRYRASMGNDGTIFMDGSTVFKYENGIVGYVYSEDRNYRKIISYFDEKGTKIAEYKWPAKDQTGIIEVTRYAPDGKLVIKNTLKQMYQIGLNVIGHYETWHENGQKRSELDVDYKKMTGVATAWHNNGQVAERVDYGAKTAVYFDPSGNSIEKPKRTIVPGIGFRYNGQFDLEAFNYIGNLILKDADNF